tara:strand:+ start:234 stop:467 length:234 start_codon:yes stop_codon:yes gene_type:complete
MRHRSTPIGGIGCAQLNICSSFSQISARQRPGLAIQQRQAEADRKPAWISPYIDLVSMDALQSAAVETRDVRHDGQT